MFVQLMFPRSVRNKLKYTTFVGDGDSIAYKSVCQLQGGAGPYGEEHGVTKEECVNHVHKWMGTTLRKLVKKTTRI